MITLPDHMPTKENNYEVHFFPSLWGMIRLLVATWRASHPGKRPYWIAPAADVQNWQEAAAYVIRNAERRAWVHEEPITLTIWLYGKRSDVDNVKIIADALQQSGRIGNDRQIVELHVYKIQQEPPRVVIAVTEAHESAPSPSNEVKGLE